MAIVPCKNYSHPLSMFKRQRKLGTARVSPLNDAQSQRPTPVIIEKKLLCQVSGTAKDASTHTEIPLCNVEYWLSSRTKQTRELADVLMTLDPVHFPFGNSLKGQQVTYQRVGLQACLYWVTQR